MALSEATNPARGSDSAQEALENVQGPGDGDGGFGHGEERGLSAAMGKEEANDLAHTPSKGGRFSRDSPALAVFDSRFDRGNVSGRSVGKRRDVADDTTRGGFPRGFSVSSSRLGSRRMAPSSSREDQAREDSLERAKARAAGMTTPEMDSSRSLAIYFDSEQVDRSSVVDDSPVYGSVRTELTPELGSFHIGQGNDGVNSEDSDADASLAALSARKDALLRQASSKRKKSAAHEVAPVDAQQLPVKSQLHTDFVLGADRGHDARRDGYITSRLFAKPLAGRDEYISNYSSPSPDVRAQANNFGTPVGGYEITFDDVGDTPGWNNVYPRGDQPGPRQFHAAAVIGRRMVVVGGQTSSGLSNDVQMLHLSRMTWTELGRGGGFANGNAGNLKAVTPVAIPGQLPQCRGHSLISWGKTVLLVGGQLTPASDRVEVWSFDLETECWTKITAKGEIPAARSGQSVTRAGSILIMFGGESLKGQKLNDLHILDLKSLMWLPLHTMGAGPSPRTKHCATMYDDRYLLVFGGASKSKPLSDLFALDFETMEWSKMKTKGITPSPRSGHAGILIGDKWYIAGGETRGQGTTETLMLDVGNLTWSGIAATTPNTAVSNQGLSLVLVQRKEKTMLVAFGGKGSELSNQVQVLYIMPLDHVKNSSYSGNSEARDGQANAAIPSMTGSGLSCACVDVAKTHLAPLAEEQYASRNSPGNSPSTESSFDLAGHVSLRRRYGAEKSKYPIVRQPPEEILSRVLRETSAQESSSPLQHFKVSDALHSDLEMRGRLAPIATRSSEKARRPGGSSRRIGSFDSTLTSVMESAECIDSSRRVAMVSDLSTRTRSHGSGRSESLYTTAQRHSWEGEECSDSQLLADLQDAMTMERRIHLINKYRQSFEMKLAAAVRKGELAEEKLTTVLRSKDEAEKSLSMALKTRQHAEGKLAASLKAQTDLRERVAAAERAQEDSNNLCNVVHSENLRLEHDLAFLKAVLEDTQKELQSTREVLATERARSFQLQMEVFDLKKRLSPTRLTGEVLNLASHTQLTPDTQLTPVSETV